MSEYIKKHFTGIIILFSALINVAIHLAVAGNLGYHRDELLYFSLGLHPAFGYNTVPPMTGWIAWLVQNLFGYSVFAVRLIPALSGGIMICLTACMAKELGGSSFARILAATGLLISGFSLRTFLLFQPVHIDLFFWTLSFFLIVRYINTSSGRYLFLFGIFAGFALLNKYLIGLLFIIIIVVIPFTQYRRVISNKVFWFGIISGSIIFLPNLVWQISTGMPVFDHLSELNRTQLVNVDNETFLADQLMIPLMASLLTIAGLVFIFFTKDGMKYIFPGIVSVLVIIALLLLNGKSYYTIGIMPFLIAAGARLWEKILRNRLLQITFTLLLIALTVPLVPAGLPVYKAPELVSYFREIEERYGIEAGRRFEDGTIHSLPQDYADMLGWEELVTITCKAWRSLPDKGAAFIYCENYGQAGAVTIIGKKYGLPQPVSFHESFKYWVPRQFEREITSVIYINDELGDDIKALFRKITVAGSISDYHAREYGTTVYICEEPVSDFSVFWEERLKQIF